MQAGIWAGGIAAVLCLPLWVAPVAGQTPAQAQLRESLERAQQRVAETQAAQQREAQARADEQRRAQVESERRRQAEEREAEFLANRRAQEQQAKPAEPEPMPPAPAAEALPAVAAPAPAAVEAPPAQHLLRRDLGLGLMIGAATGAAFVLARIFREIRAARA